MFNKTLTAALLAAILITAFCFSVEAIEDKSLVLYFSFNEGNGDVVKDLSQYKNDGTIEGNPQWVDGKFGKALVFDGSTKVEVPHDDSLNLTDAHTISFWLKWDGSGSSWSPFISKTSGAEADNYHTWVGSDQIWDYANTNARVSADTPISLDEWIFLAVTHDGTNTVSFYINGSLDNTAELSTMEANDAPFRVGDDGKGNLGAGAIDELAVFNSALTEEEINMLMEEGSEIVTAVNPAGKLSVTWSSLKNKF